VQPVPQQPSVGAAERSASHLEIIRAILEDPGLRHVYFDISWSEVAKYVVSSEGALERTAAVMDRHAERFLFGTDEVAPKDQASYLKVYEQYEPLWKRIQPDTREKVLKANYERLFDGARGKVRAWEAANVASAERR
jgi:hypothetical protein